MIAELSFFNRQRVCHRVERVRQFADLVVLLQTHAPRHIAGGKRVGGFRHTAQGMRDPPPHPNRKQDRERKCGACREARAVGVLLRVGEDAGFGGEDAVHPALIVERHERDVQRFRRIEGNGELRIGRGIVQQQFGSGEQIGRVAGIAQQGGSGGTVARVVGQRRAHVRPQWRERLEALPRV